jgi:hypothetical protein
LSSRPKKTVNAITRNGLERFHQLDRKNTINAESTDLRISNRANLHSMARCHSERVSAGPQSGAS